MKLHDIDWKKQLFRSCFPNLGDVMELSKVCPLQDVKQSGFEAALLVNPVDDLAVGRVAADRFA
jgi:hypothetical protein